MQKMLQKSLHTEIRKRGTKKYRRQLALGNKLLVKFRARAVQQLILGIPADFLFQ